MNWWEKFDGTRTIPLPDDFQKSELPKSKVQLEIIGRELKLTGLPPPGHLHLVGKARNNEFYVLVGGGEPYRLSLHLGLENNLWEAEMRSFNAIDDLGYTADYKVGDRLGSLSVLSTHRPGSLNRAGKYVQVKEGAIQDDGSCHYYLIRRLEILHLLTRDGY